MDYSVLMSVYKKEEPAFLKEAIESILSQTVPADDIVIVWDGPLTEPLEQLLESYRNQYPEIIRFLKLESNVGLGNALKEGVPFCYHSLIARMDSDDIAVSKRMEWQLEVFRNHPELSLCGGQIEEFIIDSEMVEAVRRVPCTYKEICTYAKKRNPMNHMTVMFRKEAVLEVGNYQPMELAEDYYLWVRMLMKGFKAVNLPEVLVKARVGNGMFDRRGGSRYMKCINQLMRTFYKMGFLTWWEYVRNIVTRSMVSLMPGKVREVIYKKGLRRGDT